jgi:DegV family protein with EDD domain
VIKIVTDSTCDILPAWVEQYNITVIPVNIQFGTETYQEGIAITPTQFYKRIDWEQALPTTSQPAVGEISDVYRQLIADGSQVLSLHLTSKLSGTWQAASLAARQLSGQARITVVDSWTGSVGLGFMVREAARMAETGEPLEHIVARLHQKREQIRIFLLLKDLQYARMSGRVGRVKEYLTSLLKIKPIIAVQQGALALAERTRGQQRGLTRLLALAEQAVGQTPVHVAVAHATDLNQGEQLLAMARNRLNTRDTFISDLALSIAVHFGPGTVGLVAYPVE